MVRQKENPRMGAKSATMEKDKTGTLGTTRPRETNLLVAREK
jgi:hypothetical protein